MSLLCKLHTLNLIPIYNSLFRSMYWPIRLVFVPNLNASLSPLRKNTNLITISLRGNCSYSEFFWSFISRIRTEYGEIIRISPYSVRMQENPDQKNSEYGQFHAVYSCLTFWILKTYLRLSPVYLMPPKEVIVLFSKSMLCYNFRSICLHYDDEDIHKPSFLTFCTLHTQ